MKMRGRGWARLGLVLLAVAIVPWVPIPNAIRAQNFPGPDNDRTANGLLPPPSPPPPGTWGQVIMVNPKWIVLQNAEGQQFPIAVDSITRFRVLWPTSTNALTVQSLVEATGWDNNNNVVHADVAYVYEGADQSMVAPTAERRTPGGKPDLILDPSYFRYMNAWDIASQNIMYGFGGYPVQPSVLGNPFILHVVGSMVQRNPLELAIPGMNLAAVVPGDSGALALYQVTLGSTSLVQKEDYATIVAPGMTPKSLVVTELIVVKKVSRSQFTP